jgi:hypothetical protein
MSAIWPPKLGERRLPTLEHLPSRRGRRRYPEDGSHIRKIRDSRGLDAVPTSLPLERVPAGSLARGSLPWGPKRNKPADSSHWLSLTAMPGEDRENKRAQLALPPKSGPWAVLRPEGCALPGPLRRPADPDSPRRIADPAYNRSAMGMFPSAARLSSPQGSPAQELQAAATCCN